MPRRSILTAADRDNLLALANRRLYRRLSDEHQLIKDAQASLDQDMLNTPAGNLVGVFLSTWEQSLDQKHPFAANANARLMRDTIIQATGKSGVIVKQRLVSSLRYFLDTDRQWTEQHLIAPLRDNHEQSLELWMTKSARMRLTLFSGLLRIYLQMIRVPAENRAGLETKRIDVLPPLPGVSK